MSVERKILLTLPFEAIMQQVAQSSAESTALKYMQHARQSCTLFIHCVSKVLIANISMFMYQISLYMLVHNHNIYTVKYIYALINAKYNSIKTNMPPMGPK